MKSLLLTICLAATLVAAQTPSNHQGNGGTGSFKFNQPGPSSVATLPLYWVNESEIIPPTGTYNQTRVATTFAQLQQDICDWVDAPDEWWLIRIPTVPHTTITTSIANGYTCTNPGHGYGNVNALTLYPKIIAGGMPTKFLVVDSDNPLPSKQTVCSHGITDTTGTRQPPSGDISTWWQGTNWGCANDISQMWTLEGSWTPGNSGVAIQAGGWDIATGIGPSHYAFRDVEIRPAVSNIAQLVVVNLNPSFLGGNEPCSDCTTWQSHKIHIQNAYLHADAVDWTTGATFIHGNNKVSQFISYAACADCSLTYSYADYITIAGQEGHVFAAVRSAGPLKVAHNWISSAASGVFAGGDASNDPFYYVNDFQVWQNRLTNPPSWIGHYSTWAGGQGPTIKNRLEFKSCNRCVIEANICEYVDLSGAQSGQCFTMTPRVCSASLQCDNYQVSINDITMRNNIIRHTLVPFQMAARSSYPSNGGGSGGPLRRVDFSQNLIYDEGNGVLLDPNSIVGNPYFVLPGSFGQSFISDTATRVGSVITLQLRAGPTGLKQIKLWPDDLGVITNCSEPSWNFPGDSFTVKSGTPALAGTTPDGLTFVYKNTSATGGTTSDGITFSATGCVLGNSEGFPSNLTINHNTVVMDTTGGGRNDARIFAGVTGTVYTDTGCAGAAPQNSTALTSLHWNSTGTIVTATPASNAGWSATLNADIAEVAGSGNYNGFYYYLGSPYITNFSRTSNVSTVTLAMTAADIGLTVGQSVTIVGASPTSFNGTWTVKAVSGSTFTFDQTATNVNPTNDSANISNLLQWMQTGTPNATISVGLGTAATMDTCPANNFAQHASWTDNLFAVNTTTSPSCPATPATGWSGWIAQGDGNTEGCASGAGSAGCSANQVDVTNSVITYNDFPGRCASKYMEVGGRFANSIPPVTNTFPIKVACLLNESPSTLSGGQPVCIGMKAMLNGAPFDVNTADYHNYALDSSSLYKAGNSLQADDGKDLGADIAAIDSALNATHYVCATYCGTGPH